MLIGVGFNLKDKRVDKMLRSEGITDADIYHSPIKCWLVMLLLLCCQGWVFFTFLTTTYSFLLIFYLIISYLVNAYHNNSFALHEDKITVINPNFPFRQIITIDIQDIQCIVIDQGTRKWTLWVMLFGENYLLIKTNNKNMKFYCSGLEIDSYDENMTEKTIDDLGEQLRQMGISTDFKLT